MRVLLETTCLIAAALRGHPQHAATADAIEQRRAARQEFVIAAHSLFEAYSVLTRLPVPDRLSPATALEVLENNWGKSELITLTSAESWRVVRDHAVLGVGGGRLYDGHIAHCGRKAKVDQILTWNVRHFDGYGIAAVTPFTR